MKKRIFYGQVVPNNRNGTKFGYPTANINISKNDLSGIFVGFTELIHSEQDAVSNAFSKKKLPSIVFVGVAETLNQKDYRLESFILDFPEIDLYGSNIKVTIVEKIRENQKFDSEEKLIQQMKQDEVAARKWFNKGIDV